MKRSVHGEVAFEIASDIAEKNMAMKLYIENQNHITLNKTILFNIILTRFGQPVISSSHSCCLSYNMCSQIISHQGFRS